MRESETEGKRERMGENESEQTQKRLKREDHNCPGYFEYSGTFLHKMCILKQQSCVFMIIHLLLSDSYLVSLQLTFGRQYLGNFIRLKDSLM